MSNVWFTSDTHLGHANVLQFDQRPFANIDEHDEAILERHNSIVRRGDTVYHLGDVSFSPEKLDWYLRNANGQIHLIRGNHDDRIAWKSDKFVTKSEAKYIKPGGVPIFLCHYGCRVWRNSHHGSFHLYGHSHGHLPPLGRSMDVGVMCHNYRPVALEEVVQRLSKIGDYRHHHLPR